MKLHVFKPLSVSFLIIVILAFLATSVSYPSSDGAVRYQTYLTLWENPEFSKYSTLQPAMAKVIDSVIRIIYPNLDPSYVPRLFEAVVVVGFFIFSWVLLRQGYRIAFLGLLVPLSMIPHYLGQFFSEITSSFLLAAGFVTVYSFRSSYGAFFGGILAALGLANWIVLIVPATAVFVVAFARYIRWKTENRSFVVFLGISILLGFTISLIDLSIKQQLFDNPYSSDQEVGFKTVLPYSGLPGFSHPLIIGLLGSLFSFGKSIFLFNPFLIFVFIRSYPYKIYALTFLITALLIYSQWWSWYGGFSFGTRFYLFAIVPSIFIFVIGFSDENRTCKIMEPIAVLWGFWIAICGKYFGLNDVKDVCTANFYATEAFCWYVPEFTPLINPIVTHGVIGVIQRLGAIDYIFGISVVLVYLYLARQTGAFNWRKV